MCKINFLTVRVGPHVLDSLIVNELGIASQMKAVRYSGVINSVFGSSNYKCPLSSVSQVSAILLREETEAGNDLSRGCDIWSST